MARRTRKWQPIGRWLKAARKESGFTLGDLAARTSISTSSLARFESDRAVPSFGDVCAIAQQLGWPLLYFATGQERTGDDIRATVARLQFWGLRDIRTAEPVLFGEIDPFEEVVAEVVSRPVNERVLAALPALLLRNRFEPAHLVSAAHGFESLKRVGWLADVAKHVSERLPPRASQPDTQRRLTAVEKAAAKDLRARAPETFDCVGLDPSASKAARERVWKASPPLARRWRIACELRLEEFVERAQSILARN